MPNAHGNGVTQSPLLLTKISPGGVGSDTVTSVASMVPVLVAAIEYVTLVPGVTLAGPDLVTVTLIVNSAPSGSGD